MDFESLPAHKLVIIPNGLTLSGAGTDRAAARRKLGIEPNHFAIMTIGRMEYQKNHILALRAFAELPEQTRRRTLLFFVGSGEQEVVLLASPTRSISRTACGFSAIEPTCRPSSPVPISS